MSVYYADDGIRLHHGDAADELDAMDAESVDCIVTSPPYYGLRDYGSAGQIGAEETPALYVARLAAVFRAARRVLAADGTLWLNLGDSYSMRPGSVAAPGATSTLNSPAPGQEQAMRTSAGDRPTKSLLGIPWRVAMALQDDGWILRNAIIWHKPNAMPESVTDRLSTTYETVFLLTRAQRYAFNLDAIREPHATADRPITPRDYAPAPGSWAAESGGNHRSSGPEGVGRNEAGRNPGDLWSIATQPYGGAHFAVMPRTLAERCILAGSPPGGTVLDPFSGSGTTGLAAARHGRRYVGVDLSAEYLDLSLRTRLAQGALLDAP